MQFVRPQATDVFTITSVPNWPSIQFETDAKGPHTWTWSITWGNFKTSGRTTTTDNRWDAKSAILNMGGSLTVSAEANQERAVITVKVKGTNPSAVEVTQYLSSQANSAGFDKIIAHESKFKHFKANGEPVKSFDNGYGMCQLTTPVPRLLRSGAGRRTSAAG